MKQLFFIVIFINILVAPLMGQLAFEGKIAYSLTYEPSPIKAVQVEMLPKTISLFLKGEKFRFDQTIVGGATQSYIVDNESGSSILVMNLMGQAFQVPMKKSQLDQLQAVEELKMETTSITTEILGYTCEHAYYTTDETAYDVYYTTEINAPNTMPQFKSIIGVPMKFTIIQDGMRVHYQCIEVKPESLSVDVFEVANQIKTIPFESFAKAFAYLK